MPYIKTMKELPEPHVGMRVFDAASLGQDAATILAVRTIDGKAAIQVQWDGQEKLENPTWWPWNGEEWGLFDAKATGVVDG